MSKQFLIILIALMAIFGGIIVLAKSKDDGPSQNSADGSDNVFGITDSKVELVEYGDFQCPACRSFYPIVKQIEDAYGDRVVIRFRHFPLTNLHPNAFAAHRAAQAAANQNAFWQMHDVLYERQPEWSDVTNPSSIFEDYAGQLNLNLEQFKTDFQSPETAATINKDLGAAQSLGFTGTPSFTLNGKEIERPQTFEEFATILDKALQEAGSPTVENELTPVTE